MRAGSATRVAAVATIIVAVVYIACVAILNIAVYARLTARTDDHLADQIAAVRHDPAAVSQRTSAERRGDDDDDDDSDVDAAPVFLWMLNADSQVASHSLGAPALSAALLDGVRGWSRAGRTLTAGMSSSSVGTFRLMFAWSGSGWLVAGQSTAADAHTEHLLLDAEVVAGPLILLAMFAGSLIVGLRALAPVEQSRRRQLEFTADASHELRTPLSVITAETDLALSGQRPVGAYRDTLTRIQAENQRLTRLVDDMLWLARFDSAPPAPHNEPVDVATLVEGCADRFRTVGRSASVTITVETTSPAPGLIDAPPAWIDRLAGVLLDNACRYAGVDGKVRIGAQCSGSKVSLTVEDSGPGIPEADRPKIFDRFHRATEHGAGTGLGLAIADSIVRSTGGRWRIVGSPLGGALMEVSWRHAQPRRLGGQRMSGDK
jgi:two-component system sensor histidine kinase CiaH